jgi:putative tricarboxylic transport membrane protein
MGHAPKFRLETCFGFLLLVLGIAITVISIGYGFGSLVRPGPGLYPVFLGIAIAVFSFFILLADLKSESSKSVLDEQSARTFAFMAATFCLWVVAMPILGYVTVTLLDTYAFCKILKLEGWKKPLAVAGGTALCLYLLFDYWLYIDLPRGILG